MKTLSSRPLSLASEIFCTKAVTVASLYVLFIQAYNIQTWRREYTSNKNSFDIKYFTLKAQNMNEWSYENVLNLVSWH